MPVLISEQSESHDNTFQKRRNGGKRKSTKPPMKSSGNLRQARNSHNNYSEKDQNMNNQLRDKRNFGKSTENDKNENQIPTENKSNSRSKTSSNQVFNNRNRPKSNNKTLKELLQMKQLLHNSVHFEDQSFDFDLSVSKISEIDRFSCQENTKKSYKSGMVSVHKKESETYQNMSRGNDCSEELARKLEKIQRDCISKCKAIELSLFGY